PPIATENDAALLWAVIGRPDAEDQIAFRDGQRFVARLARVRAAESHKLKFQPDASYLITGGLGTLGLRLAQWMGQQEPGAFILTARRDPSSQAQDSLSQLRQAGAQVSVVKADVSDEEAMGKL